MRERDMLAILDILQEKTFDFASIHGISDVRLQTSYNQHADNFRTTQSSTYSNNRECISYALRYGIKTAFQTWYNFKNDLPTNASSIFLIGGGCSYELPIFLPQLTNEDIHVKVLDINAANWNIFGQFHEDVAQSFGKNLEIEFVDGECSQENIDKIIEENKPNVVIASNMLNEVEDSVLDVVAGVVTQNCDLYLQDMNGLNLGKILRKVCSIQGNAWPSYSYPINNFPSNHLLNSIPDRCADRYSGHNGRANYKFFGQGI